MTRDQIIGLAAALLLMLAGMVGSVIPGLPGTPILMAAALGHRFYFGEHGPSTLVLVLMGVLMGISLILDYAAGMLGARKMGATWRGVVGAMLGAIVGVFFGLPGLILGPFLGAMLLEAWGGRKWGEAGQAGAGALLGLLLGAIGKLACGFAMIALFTVSVIMRSGSAPAP